jgi:hypothetical protein
MNLQNLKEFLANQTQLTRLDYLALAKVATHAAYLATDQGPDPKPASRCHFLDASQSELDGQEFWWCDQPDWDPVLETELPATDWLNLAQWILARAAEAHQPRALATEVPS